MGGPVNEVPKTVKALSSCMELKSRGVLKEDLWEREDRGQKDLNMFSPALRVDCEHFFSLIQVLGRFSIDLLWSWTFRSWVRGGSYQIESVLVMVGAMLTFKK